MSGTGRYRVVRTIGRGGMAEVLEAIATGEGGFERRVAIKRMLPEFHDEADFATLFLDEARTASALHHANLVAVLDYGLADDLPFQVLEFVDGLDAERLFQMGRTASEPMPVDVALYLCLQIAHALDYVHSARDANDAPLGVVHRDVSPSNVLVAWSGDVKLADFGIAIARTRRTETSAGVVRGKPAFMAPEQLVRGELDGRTDCFALACTLHALIVGTSPLARENAMPSLLAGAALELDPKLPDDVRAIVARSVRSAKSARHENAAAMAREIVDALARRGATDSRGALQSWLAKIRPPPRATPRSALDALLMDEIVVKDPTAEVRRFVTVPAKRERIISQPIAPLDRPTRPERVKRDATDSAQRPTRPERLARDNDEPAERATRPERAPRVNDSDHASDSSARSISNTPPPAPAASSRESKRGRRIAIGIAALVFAAIGIGVQSFTHRASATASAVRPAIANERPEAAIAPNTNHEPAVTPAALVAAPTAPPVETPSVAPSVIVAAPHTQHVEPPHRIVHTVTSTGPRDSAPAPAAVAPVVEPAHAQLTTANAANATESATGVLALGGDGAQRAAIYIDDQARGFAPRALVLPVGTHTLRLVRPDGETLGPRSIEVLAQHTQSAPLRIRFP